MKKIVTFGVFDYFHLGYLRLFKQCRDYGDYLIVAVQNGEYIKRYKPDAQVLYSTEERVEILQSIREIDEVYVFDICDRNALNRIDFDILALGEDHVGSRFDGMIEWCEEHGKHVVRLKRTKGISSRFLKTKLEL